MKDPLFKPGWNVPTESWRANKIMSAKKERSGDATDRTSVGSRPSVPFHVAPSSALRCGHCL